MERDVPELRGIVIVMSRATRVINVQQYNIFVLSLVVQSYRQVPGSKCCNTVQYVCNIHPVWLDSLNTSIIHFLFSCTQLVFLQRCCMPSSIGLALDICLAITRLCFQAKSLIHLAALLTQQFTHKFCTFSLSPSLWRCCWCINKMWFTSPIWLSVWSCSDFPKLCVFTLFQYYCDQVQL